MIQMSFDCLTTDGASNVLTDVFVDGYVIWKNIGTLFLSMSNV